MREEGRARSYLSTGETTLTPKRFKYKTKHSNLCLARRLKRTKIDRLSKEGSRVFMSEDCIKTSPFLLGESLTGFLLWDPVGFSSSH
jgi:hypothetical protein